MATLLITHKHLNEIHLEKFKQKVENKMKGTLRVIKDVTFIILISYSLYSCSNSGKLIGKTRTPYGTVKFYEVDSFNNKSKVVKIYADVDSSGTKMYYSFYRDKIVKTEESAKHLSYTVSFDKMPNSYDDNIYRRLSHLDTIVLSKADSLFKTLNYSNLQQWTGAEAYLIEVNYYHGWPKNRKFQPL